MLEAHDYATVINTGRLSVSHKFTWITLKVFFVDQFQPLILGLVEYPADVRKYKPACRRVSVSHFSDNLHQQLDGLN